MKRNRVFGVLGVVLAVATLATFAVRAQENPPAAQKKMIPLSVRRCILLTLLIVELSLGSGAQIPSSPDRDVWQRPEEVMDAMRAHTGSTVADVGAGEGWFSLRLARRVGTDGKVYAVDINPKMIGSIRNWVANEKLSQVVPVLGADNNPHLPKGKLDAILVVDAYHEMRKYDAMMQSFRRALKAGGRLVIIEPDDNPYQPREVYLERHTIPVELVRDDAERNRFHFVERRADIILKDDDVWTFLVFEKPTETLR